MQFKLCSFRMILTSVILQTKMLTKHFGCLESRPTSCFYELTTVNKAVSKNVHLRNHFFITVTVIAKQSTYTQCILNLIFIKHSKKKKSGSKQNRSLSSQNTHHCFTAQPTRAIQIHATASQPGPPTSYKYRAIKSQHCCKSFFLDLVAGCVNKIA